VSSAIPSLVSSGASITLQSLGVNALELMPVTSVKQDFDWGYGPVGTFCPREERYGWPTAHEDAGCRVPQAQDGGDPRTRSISTSSLLFRTKALQPVFDLVAYRTRSSAPSFHHPTTLARR